MHGFYTEKRKIPSGASLSKDLAQHIFIRGVRGGIVVVAEHPQDLASVTKKQWHALIRLVQRERASTLRAARIAELSDQLSWMQRLVFTAKPLDELPESCVLFTKVSAILQKPPICSTLYMAQELTPEQFHLITSWLPENSVVVIYDLKD